MGEGSKAGFLSGVVWLDKLRCDGLPRRWIGVPLGDLSIGDAAKKLDFLCARLDPGLDRGGSCGLNDAVESRLDFSASALILCAMPPETLTEFILAGGPISSLLVDVVHGPDDFLASCSGDVRVAWLNDVDAARLGGEEILGSDGCRGKTGMIGDLDTDIGFACRTSALRSSSIKESSDRYSASELSALTWMGSSSALRFSFVWYQLSLFEVGRIIDSLLRLLDWPSFCWMGSSGGM